MPKQHVEWNSNNTLHIAVRGNGYVETPALELRSYDTAADEMQHKVVALQSEAAKLLYGDAEQGGSIWSCPAQHFDDVMGTKYAAFRDEDDNDELHEYRTVVYIVLESSIVVINCYEG